MCFQVPGFAAPRAAQVQPEQQQPLLKAVKDRHSAPSPSPAAAVVPVTTDSLPMAEQSSAEPKSKKQQMRHSVPAAPRQPLACVSNNPPRTQQSKSASKRAARDSSTAGVQSLAKKQKSPAADIGDESGEETLITRKSRSSASAASSGNQSLVINSGSESEDDFQPAK